ncbi:hypothetical protein ACLIBH_13230 [Virgibacillus sp. W0430]|uniref:hypothetical protein n=1 Tax=Virgibacillus sp. W0430 TaxID=3391580 RepID=UPI003F44E981
MEFDNKKRAQIIIKEIEYWKDHKLLPGRYCDFLLALYTKGEYDSDRAESEKINWLFTLRIILLILLLPTAFCFVYFIQLHGMWQAIVFIIFILLTYRSMIAYKNVNNTYYYNLALFVFLCLILLFSYTWMNYFFSSSLLLNTVIAVNLIIWLLLGYYKKSAIIGIASILGALLFIMFIIY